MSHSVWTETDTDAGLIVVGVDGTDAAMSALRWAVVEARRTGARVEAVYVYGTPEIGSSISGRAGLPPPLPADRSVVLRSAEEELARAVRRSLSDPSPVLMTTAVVAHESAARALAHQAEHADVLVIGSRRPNRRSRLSRSTTAELLKHAPCPVVVVPNGEPVPSPEEIPSVLTPA